MRKPWWKFHLFHTFGPWEILRADVGRQLEFRVCEGCTKVKIRHVLLLRLGSYHPQLATDSVGFNEIISH